VGRFAGLIAGPKPAPRGVRVSEFSSKLIGGGRGVLLPVLLRYATCVRKEAYHIFIKTQYMSNGCSNKRHRFAWMRDAKHVRERDLIYVIRDLLNNASVPDGVMVVAIRRLHTWDSGWLHDVDSIVSVKAAWMTVSSCYRWKDGQKDRWG
jgi:hypothetical protein